MKSGTNRRLALLASLAITWAIAGCGKSSTSVAPGTCTGSIGELTLRVNRALPVGSVIPAGLDTAATVFSIRVDSLTAPIAVGASALLAERPALLRLTAGGTITVASGAVSQAMFDDSLCVAQLASEAHVYSTFTSTAGATLALPFDGTSYHRFTATGREYPAFTDSILSVAPIQVLSPAANFVQDDTTTLTVTWTPSTTDTNVKVLCQLRDDSNTLVRSVAVNDDAGTARILGAAVAALPTRVNVVLTVARYRVLRRQVGTTLRPLAMFCQATDQRPITLTAHTPNVALARGHGRTALAPASAERGTPGERFLRLPAYLRAD